MPGAPGDEVGHLLGVDAVALAHAVRANLSVFAALQQFRHGDTVGDGAVEVAIAGQQQRLPAALLLGARVREHHVVRLEIRAGCVRPAEAGEQRRRLLPLRRELRRHRVAVGVVGRVQPHAIVRLLSAHARHDAVRRARR
jgi:hypothetical protein